MSIQHLPDFGPRKKHDPHRQRPETDRGGHVYFIQGADGGPIKIGYSTDTTQRLHELQIGSPIELRMFGVIEGSKRLEAEIHKQLAAHRLHGEWFTDCPEVRAAIGQLGADNAKNTRRPSTSQGEDCMNCQVPLVVDEDMLCKACVEFIEDWASPEVMKLWSQTQQTP